MKTLLTPTQGERLSFPAHTHYAELDAEQLAWIHQERRRSRIIFVALICILVLSIALIVTLEPFLP